MTAGQLSARRLVEMYLARIEALDRNGPALRSIIETNPDALDLAEALDRERSQQGARGPLHGIPILLKDNIDTADRMATTAGSLALAGSRVARDATVAQRLRAAGAILLGKANMSEWANFRSSHSSSGWSGRGGQARNPYSLERSPSGSSSGSATATAAALCAVALGTETDGSVLSPGGANGVVGIKPTVGMTSRAGVIPIAHSQDTVGVFGRTVADAAAALSAIAGGADPRDPATEAAPSPTPDYTSVLDESALRGARIGVVREVYFDFSEKANEVVELAINTLRAQGAFVVDPANIATARQMRASDCEYTVLLYEFKADLDAYLATLLDAPVRTLADIITFNQTHAEQELRYFGQDTMIRAQAKGPLTTPEYQQALAESRHLARVQGLDAVMDTYQLDALVAPTNAPSWKIDLVNGDPHTGGSAKPAAMAGYPAITVPAGEVSGLPVGITFMGRAFSEARLLALAYAFEQATHARRAPTYRETTP